MSPRWEFCTGDAQHAADAVRDGDAVRVRLDDGPEIVCEPAGDGAVDLLIDGRRRRAWVARAGAERLVFLDGAVIAVHRCGDEDDDEADAAGGGGPAVRAEMPGTVVKILVSEGDAVSEGAPLLIMEAMKMETEITAPHDGVVGAIPTVAGAVVAQDDLLLTVEPVAEDAGS